MKIGTVSVHVSALSVDMFSLFQIFFFVIVVEVLFQRVRLEHECLITVSKHEKGGEAPSDSLLSRVFRYRDQTRRTSVEIVPQTKAINNCCVPFLRTIHDCKPIRVFHKLFPYRSSTTNVFFNITNCVLYNQQFAVPEW